MSIKPEQHGASGLPTTPPFAVVEQRKAPRAEVPHGMLSDPRWVATQLGYLRDVETIQERTQKSHGQQPGARATSPDAPKGRGRRGGKNQQEAAASSSQ